MRVRVLPTDSRSSSILMAWPCNLESTAMGPTSTVPFNVNTILAVLVFVRGSGTQVCLELCNHASPLTNILVDDRTNLMTIFRECIKTGQMADREITDLILEAQLLFERAVALESITETAAASLIGIPAESPANDN
jgi:hypothetical protein